MSENAKFNVVPLKDANRPDSPVLFDAEAQARQDAEAAAAMYDVDLPIYDELDRIEEAVNDNQAVIVIAEPGSGKTTQVPQKLADGRVVTTTQPRVFAVTSVADYTQKQIVHRHGEDYKHMVGYKTGRGKSLHRDNQIIIATDAVIANETGRQATAGDVLVIDEAHEMNWFQEVLIAEARQEMDTNPDYKIVLMSGSMDPRPYAEFLAGDGNREVPIVEVPGRTFPLAIREGTDVVEETVKAARDGKKNVLTFMPGKAEIEEVIASIKEANIPGITVLPLHGQLSAEEQAKVFLDYPDGLVVVSTDVAESSVTIPGIDVVVDPGLRRHMGIKNGVKTMELVTISQAKSKQRGGRASRTKPGEYIYAPYHPRNGKVVPYTPLAERPVADIPEILNMNLDAPALLLAARGHDISTMRFRNQPEVSDIAAAQERLRHLGALNPDNTITDTGKEMQRMPLDPYLARMVVESRKYQDPALQAQAAVLVSIMAEGNLLRTKRGEAAGTEGWRHLLGSRRGNESDLVKQVEIYSFAQVMSDDDKEANDISRKSFKRVNDTIKQLRAISGFPEGSVTTPNHTQREQLVKCIIAGMVDNIYIDTVGQGVYTNTAGDARRPGRQTLIQPGGIIIGSPFDMQINTRNGEKTLSLLQDVTNVPSMDIVREVAPQLFTPVHGGYRIDTAGNVVDEISYQLNGLRAETKEHAKSAPSEERRQFLANMAGRYAEQHGYGSEIQAELDELQQRTPGRLPSVRAAFISRMLLERLRVEAASVPEALAVLPPLRLDSLIAADVRAEIYAAAPQSYGGLELEYKDGWPYAEGYSSMRLMRKPDAELMLPDGRNIYATWNGEIQPLVGIKRALQQRYQKHGRR